MKELIKRSYQAIKGRGLIDEKTRNKEFVDKMYEELDEICESGYVIYAFTEKDYIEEVTDLATVCIMQIHHLGYDFIKEFEKVVIKNEKRANEISKRK